MNYIPAPKSIELHLGGSPDFSRGYSAKVKALGGKYTACRGDSNTRFVTLPFTDEGRKLANTLVALFGKRETTLIARGLPGSFRGRHIHAPVVVHHISASSVDPCQEFLASYEAEFLRAFPDAVNPEPEQPKPPVVEIDEDEQPVSITLTKAQARVVLAALSRRCIELENLGGWEANILGGEAKAIYQSVDKQVYGEHAAVS